MIKKEGFTFDSRDGMSKVHAVRWVPDGKVSCILQIVHGMAEHIERYEEMAEFFAKRGILVTGEDHLGHGKTVPEGGTFGYFCKQDPATVAVRDVHRLKKMTQKDYPGVPYVILGHSMGSFMLRNYLFRYGTGIQGAVICGTGYVPQPLITLGLWLAKAQGLFMGDDHVSGLLDKIAFGTYGKGIKNPRTRYDWLAANEESVDRYLSDPLCGFTFTVNGFKTMFELIIRTNRGENLLKMPKEIPVLFLSGEEDPVGDYGVGVRKAYKDFEKAGMTKIGMKLYPGCRHEIFNEKNKTEVCEALYSWLMERMKEYQI